MSERKGNHRKLLILVFVLMLIDMSFGQNIYLFDDPVYYNSGYSPVETATADLNGDGHPDLVVLNYSGSNVSILLNNGNGTFQDQNLYSVMSNPRGLKIADYNNDTFPDIVTTCLGANVVSYLQNNGDGTFATSINSATQQQPWGIDSYDFNGDSFLDLAVVNSESNSFQILLNNQDGTFTSSFSALSGAGSKYLTIGDLNEDSYPEIVITRNYVNYIFNIGVLTVFKNNGDGTFTKYIDDEFGSGVSNIYIYDFNGDSYSDIITNSLLNNSYKMCFFLNDGLGNFGEPVTTFGGYQGEFTMGDFDINGYMDFAVSENQYNASGMAIVLNNGNFNFDPVFSFYVGDQPRGPSSGDFDSDGDLDIAVPIYNSAQVAIIMNTLNPVPVELVSFTAFVSKYDVTLNWRTGTEKNNSGFEILRSAQNDNNWNQIGFIEGHGTTTEENVYSFVDKNLEPGSYSYKLVQIDFDGTRNESEVVTVEILNQPDEYSISQNYPNPFNPATTIQYSIPENGNVALKIFNALGKEVANLVNEFQQPGIYKVNFNGENLGSGVYYYRLESGRFSQTNKMILLR
ncbi:MAG: T9SS type A sorting domain-containing protein [Ignavibacteriaceae bacterium]|nr:T9SS type A sorting domain-containing protein [Ignavibacteriaceae bacterium]MCW8962028.1 T9SS type A sorting domain-containing protein [Ignavibacteriaceae bacterium]